jgi:GT2 family glycosyltransferase
MKRFFSIIIPTYNRPAPLERCLRALNDLDYPRDRMEVVVVDDGGACPLEELVERRSWGFPLRLLRQKNSGPAAARNRGAQAAVGEYLAFTDDDCCPDPGWLSALDQAMEMHVDGLFGGHIQNGLPENRFSATSQLLVDYLYEYFRAQAAASSFFTSNNIAMKRSALLDLGGFDTSYPLAAAEDREFCTAWKRNGGSLVYVPQALVLHFHQLSLRGFWMQNFRYGRGAARFHLGHRRGANENAEAERIKFEPLRFYLGMFAFPFHRAPSGQAAEFAGLLAIAQLAHSVGYFAERAAPVHGQARATR